LLLFVHFKAVSYTLNYFYNLHNFKQEWKEDENGLPASGSCEKACGTVWFCPCLRITFPFLFFFCFGDGEGHGLLLGSFVFLLLEIAWKLAAPWFFSCLCITFPFLFSFCFCDDEGHDLLLGFFFFLACRGAIEDENINTGFLGLLLVLVPILWVSILCLSQFFLSFPASPSLCFAFFSPPWGRLCSAFIEPATASVVVTVAHHPKCSVTAAFNEENVCVSC